MVISDEHKYVFIEHSRSASTAIARELVRKYGGRRILFKHASYDDFTAYANDEQKKYFTFSGLRHPMDIVVSHYTKLRSDHKGRQSNRKWNRKGKGKLRVYFNKSINSVLYRDIVRRDATFPQFFRKFYYLPFTDWSMVSHHKLDFIIRFENLQDDFSELLQKLNLKQKREMRVVNPSEGKAKDFAAYYDDSCIKRAKFVFGPYCQHWEYKLPESWNHQKVSFLSRVAFKFVNWGNKFYYYFLR